MLGPTATGKTRLGVGLARRFEGEVVSADSRQVYRGMDIGTGKDRCDYGVGAAAVPVHLLDLAEPREEFNLHRYIECFRRVLAQLAARRRLPVVVGGSPLYLKAIIEDYDLPGGPPNHEFRQSLSALSDSDLVERLRTRAPDLLSRVDLTQRRRVVRALEIARTRNLAECGQSRPPRLTPLLLAPYYPRAEVHRRIEQRLRERLREGLLEEVEGLHKAGVSWERLACFGLEYRCAAEFLAGRIEYDRFFERLLASIRRFCKAQDCWYRRFERDGWPIHWLPEGDFARAAELVERFLAGRELPPPALRLQDIRYGPRSDRHRRKGTRDCRRDD